MDDAVKALFILANKPRIEVITDKRAAVFHAGRLRRARQKPKSLLQSLPPTTLIEHGEGRRSKLALGVHRIRVERNV